MFIKRLTSLFLFVLFVTSAFSQGRPANIFVGKCLGQAGCNAQYSTINAALNAANPGDIIEIIDTEVYAEQITIGSSKSGITIRSTNPTNREKPVIRWRDVVNVSPINHAEAENCEGTNANCGNNKNPVCGVDGYAVGCSQNFSTNGAVRIIQTMGITLDGLAYRRRRDYGSRTLSVWF